MWRRDRFHRSLALITLGGLAIRLAFVLFTARDQKVWGDSYVYHWGARLFAEGHGFIKPLHFNVTGEKIQTAAEPPTFILFLAFFSWLPP
ncbi:MAG: hypothetical protein C4344_06230, partial [Acidimicrobiia bacterium]